MRNQVIYTRANGSIIREKSVVARIRALAIPPAWTDVWICPSAAGHIQATGRDAKGRKQYIYHSSFREIRDQAKYEHLMEFAQALPMVRQRVKKHMALRGLSRRRVLATIVYLLETTLIRVGNADYAKKNRSYGVTTLRTPHVQINGAEILFNFKGKTGKIWRVKLKDRRVAKVLKACQELPGQQLFQYEDEQGRVQNVGSTDVNRYLREITGRDITAKDFRTWAGTLLAALELATLSPAETPTKAKRNIKQVAKSVAERLGNTPTICLNCYIHPGVLQLYSAGLLKLRTPKGKAAKNPDADFISDEELAVIAILRRAARFAESSSSS
ncbi:DNA topoisomerase IB [Dongia soli]|uniref:DNA topoisomerase n=1 Tax=Dongia soli TaxID=600628 RepID=A0ABU5EDX5_9PROT|nr:DNA topoisomerase IB [Dongia soli]MDY0884411.1 DNA topoisomerase IB [Dongia soli]